MERRRKTLEELNLLDDFLFNAMLTYPDTGEAFIRKLLETLFDRKFPHLKIHPQKTFIGLNTGLRGARLDVYIEEDGSVQIHDEAIPTVYDVEPDHNKDAAQIKAFPKRTRFYHAAIDRVALNPGENFGKLKKVYVIFICDYDPSAVTGCYTRSKTNVWKNRNCRITMMRRPGCCTPGTKKATYPKAYASCLATWRTRTRAMRSMRT